MFKEWISKEFFISCSKYTNSFLIQTDILLCLLQHISSFRSRCKWIFIKHWLFSWFLFSIKKFYQISFTYIFSRFIRNFIHWLLIYNRVPIWILLSLIPQIFNKWVIIDIRNLALWILIEKVFKRIFHQRSFWSLEIFFLIAWLSILSFTLSFSLSDEERNFSWGIFLIFNECSKSHFLLAWIECAKSSSEFDIIL